MDLKELRKYINVIDGQLITLLSQRINLAESFAKVKKAQNLPLKDPEREAKMKAQYTVQAQVSNLDPNFVWNVFEVIIKEMLIKQEEAMKKL